MTALLCIDTATCRVRRYAPKRAGGRVVVTDEVSIIRPQCESLVEQLNALLAGEPIQYAEVEPDPVAA